MTGRPEMRVSSVAAFAWIIMLGLIAWAVGAYPTYRLSGKDGLAAQGVASAIVFAATTVSVLMTSRLAARGPRAAAMGMLVAGFARLALIVAAVLLVRWLSELNLTVLLIWTGLFYLAMFGGEVVWFTRALSHDTYMVALGEINRDEEHRPTSNRTGETE